MDKNQEYWNILNNINDWIKYSDTKATLLLTLYGVIITIIYSNSVDVLEGLKNSNYTLVLSIAGIFFSIASIVNSFLCINPRLKNKNPNSIIYFGHIQSKFSTAKEYFKSSSEIISNDKSYQKEISEQIYTNSKIAWKKFSNVTWAIRFFFASLLITIASTLTYLLPH